MNVVMLHIGLMQVCSSIPILIKETKLFSATTFLQPTSICSAQECSICLNSVQIESMCTRCIPLLSDCQVASIAESIIGFSSVAVSPQKNAYIQAMDYVHNAQRHRNIICAFYFRRRILTLAEMNSALRILVRGAGGFFY